MAAAGAIVANLVGTGRSSALHRYLRVNFHNDFDRRNFVSMGAAAGVAAAFNAPIGGVLYMFEEIASFWTHRTTMWAFLCTTVGAGTMNVLLSVQHSHSGVDYTPLVIFDDAATAYDW